MYAIVEIGGMQLKAEESKVLRVPKMDVEPGQSIALDQVLLVVDNENIQIGKPVVKDVQIQVKVLSHGKDKKVMVFKKKRRKGYKVLKGHRQEYTDIQVEKIVAKGVKPAATKTEAVKVSEKPDSKAAKPKKAPAAAKKAGGTAEKKIAKPAAPKSAVKKAAPKKAGTAVAKAKAAPKKAAKSAKKEG
jgi:large subunit ribosomal protein L21